MNNDYPPQSPFATGLPGRCPRCGQGKLFDGFITLAPRCNVCGLDFGFADAGDGPAVFVTLLAGFVVVGIALLVEVYYEPPYWVHLVVFLPLTLVVCLGMLRPLKGLLIALQYRNRAEQGPVRAVRRIAPVLVAAGVGVAILVGLGAWQLQRLHWKEAILAQIETRRTAPVTNVPPETDWASLKPEDYDYRHVAVVGTYETAESALVYRGGAQNAPGAGPGYFLLTPLRLPDGAVVIVNRGFAPLAQADEARANVPQGAVSVTGLMRPPESRNAFTPADAPDKGIWYTRDPLAIGAKMVATHVAPFTIDADADAKARGWPRAGATLIDIPNNHLSYALTWFGLAAALIGVTAVFLRGVRRGRRI